MIWLIAWKNVWRNKRRSFVVIAAVTIGIISGVLLVGIMQGWVEQRLHDAIYNEVSHIQVHNSDYVRNEEIDLTVRNSDEIIREAGSFEDVKGWVKRTRIFAMANTPWANTGVIAYGIDPEKEREVTEIYREVVPGAGTYLESESRGDILISDKTAELLKLKQYIVTDSALADLKRDGMPEDILIKLDGMRNTRFRSPKDFRDALKESFSKKELDRHGEKIMDKALDYRIRNKVQITISDLSGTPVQGVFRVCGIYRTTNTGYDQVSVFVNAEGLKDLYGGDTVLTHEIALLLKNTDGMEAVKEKISKVSGENTVRTWKELAPDAAMMNDFMVMYYFIFIGIILLALAFGIINTMMMAILERTKELGMLMAIGMNRKRVFSMIMSETIFLTITGAVAGIISGWTIISLLGRTGIHFTGWGEGFEAIGFAARVYPVVTPDFFVIIIIMVILTAVISSIWPARKALKLIPVEALRTE